MAEPTDLTTIIAEAICKSVRATNDPTMWERMESDERLLYMEDARAVVAALREARTVRTVDELDALPVGTVVLWSWPNEKGVAPASDQRGRTGWSRFSPVGHARSLAGGAVCRVLWRPDEDGAQS